LVDRLAKVLNGEEAPFTIVTKIYLRPGAEDEFEKVAVRVSKASAAEKGCLVYEFHRDLEKPTNYTLIETWSGLGAIKAHLKQDHTKEIQTAMTEMSTTPRTTEIFATSIGR
jgi:quinol monooxygenase YgiN